MRSCEDGLSSQNLFATRIMSRVVMMFLLLVGGEALTCEPGKGGIDSCVECEPGRFNDKHRLAECDKCPKGRFAEFSGSLTCELCPGGKHESRVVTAQSGGHWPRRVGPAPAIDSGGRSRGAEARAFMATRPSAQVECLGRVDEV